MRKVILKSIDKNELKDEIAKKIEKENKNFTTYSQSQTYQQPQTYNSPYNPFNQDIKYEFMLFAMNPIVGAIYQIFKVFGWIMYSVGYLIGRFIRVIRVRRTKKSTRVII